MKTNDLRALIVEQLQAVAPTYYVTADADALYPHIVYGFNNIDLMDKYRDDYVVNVDVWHKSDPYGAEEMADLIDNIFNAANLPQDTILPTFYRVSRFNVPDEDKTINHIVLKYQAQVYERR